MRRALELLERRASAAANAQQASERDGRYEVAAHYYSRAVAFLEAADILRDAETGAYDPLPDGLAGDPMVDGTGGAHLMTPDEIKKARQSAGLTQQATADLLGVSIKTVQSWEGGWRTMPEPMWRLFSLLACPHSGVTTGRIPKPQ